MGTTALESVIAGRSVAMAEGAPAAGGESCPEAVAPVMKARERKNQIRGQFLIGRDIYETSMESL